MSDFLATSPESQESDFTRQIYRKYQNHFVHYYRLHQLAEWALVNYGAVTKDAYQ